MLCRIGVLAVLAMAGAANAAEVSFSASPPPATEAEMAGVVAGASLTVAGKTHPMPFRVLFRSGDAVGGARAGLVVDREGRAIGRSLPGKKEGQVAEGPFFANAPDANSLIRTSAGIRLVTHFEYHPEAPAPDGSMVNLYGALPMLMTLAGIEKDKDGLLAARKVENIDFAGVDGLWIPCAGSLTPWNSHLGSEEYEPDARTYEAKPLEVMNLYRGTPGKTAAAGGADPYRYGYVVEVALDAQGRPQVAKRHAMGRLSHELGEVMPDKRTVYLTDDGRDVAFFMFVADREGDLSAGTLHAAQWRQTSAEAGGKADLGWIRLGHAGEKEIKALIDKGIRFSDIFEVAEAPAEGFRPVQAYTGTGGKTQREYLRLKPGMETAAAFLESRRYAGYLGATTEFTKMEGLAHDGGGRRLYSAMSYVEGAMLEGKNEARPRDDVRLAGDARDLACGVVYESRLEKGRKDSEGRPIASDWVAATMAATVTGARKPKDQTAYGKHDKCDTDRVANPDNLKFSEVLGTLFIGEDSGKHLNNFLWAWRPGSGGLTRLMSAPAGAELTGLQVVEDLDGHAYVMTNIQHPGATEDLAKYTPEVTEGLGPKVDKRGVVGYLGPLPALK